MSEIEQGSMAFLSVILTACAAWIQMRGGRPGGRIYYRLYFPLFFSSSVLLIALLSAHFTWHLLLFFPYYLLVTHLGHTKFHERLIECVLYGSPSILFGFTMLFTIQMILCVIAAFIGHFCRDKKAPVVEFIVNFLRIALVGVMCV